MIKIYGFLEGPVPTGGWEVTATCECGTRLLQHISAQAEDARDDIGVTSQKYHDLYQAHCTEQHDGEAFQIEWIDDSSNYQGLHQPDIEVQSWSKEDLTSLSHALHTAFPADRRNGSTPHQDKH